jgi:cytochrome oxidase Cu insertion factor (SCO1/SenC/PrrC family)
MTSRPRSRALVTLLGLALVLVAAARPATAGDKVVDDLLFELQLVPLDGQDPAPFDLERFADGTKVTLAELRGKPILLYFWATW